jgi:hypothetical protein
MQEDAELQALEAELEQLKALEKEKKSEKSGFQEYVVEPLKGIPHKAARHVKLAAKALVSPLNLPVIPYNLVQGLRGKEGINYPSDKAGEGVDWATRGLSKSRTSAEKSMDPYLEAVGTMPVGAGLGQAAKLAGLAKTGKFLNAGSALTPANLALNMGSVYGGKRASEMFPESNIAPLIGSIAGGNLSARGANLTQLPSKSIKSWGDFSAKAAIRHPKIGETFIQELPEHYGAKEILNKSHVQGGELAQKGIKQYKEKADKLWNSLERKMHDTATFHSRHGIAPEHPMSQYISAEKPLSWAVKKFNKLESPLVREAYIMSPIGVETKKLMGLPTSLNADQFAEKISKNPELLKKSYAFADVLRYRRNIDNSLSAKVWNQIGSIDEGELKSFRRLINEEIGDKFKNFGNSAYSQWKRYNNAYEKYASTKIKKINEISAHKYDPSEAYDASLKNLGEIDSHPEFVLKTLKGKDKQDYALTIMRDMGKVGKKFDIQKFSERFHNLEDEAQNTLMKALQPKARNEIKTQLSALEGYKNILGEEKGLADLLFRSPALSVSQAIKKSITKKAAGAKWKTPEGRQKLVDAALRSAEGKTSTTPAPTHSTTARSLSSASRTIPIVQDQELSNLLKEAQELGINTDGF